MEVVDFCKLMKDNFQVFSDRVPEAPKYMRFIGPPYKPEDPACKSVDVPTHGTGWTLIAPLIIVRVISKFDKTEDDFKDAHNALFARK
jgi:hypothetical protein